MLHKKEEVKLSLHLSTEKILIFIFFLIIYRIVFASFILTKTYTYYVANITHLSLNFTYAYLTFSTINLFMHSIIFLYLNFKSKTILNHFYSSLLLTTLLTPTNDIFIIMLSNG